MAKSRKNHATKTNPKSHLSNLGILISALVAVSLAFLLFRLDNFETSSYPMHEFAHKTMSVPTMSNAASLPGVEKILSGQLSGPEDLVYDSNSGVIYTGCKDGWIKRVTLNNNSVADSMVENLINTGGRPLGLALGVSGEIFVADAHKGLLKVRKDGEIELLTDEAEGLKFKLLDGVVAAKDGMLYFTDATHKYDYYVATNDMLEGKPHGRFISYDPLTKETKVIARDLYFANGIELSPDQDFVIFCESFMRRCNRYYIKGERKGSIDVFVDNLPGFPDNVRYDGNGHYWIAIPCDNSLTWQIAQKYPFIRKIFAFMGKHGMWNIGGVIAVDLEGKPIGGYYDNAWTMSSVGLRIGEHLYLGSVKNSHIVRLNLTQYPVDASSSAT